MPNPFLKPVEKPQAPKVQGWSIANEEAKHWGSMADYNYRSAFTKLAHKYGYALSDADLRKGYKPLDDDVYKTLRLQTSYALSQPDTLYFGNAAFNPYQNSHEYNKDYADYFKENKAAPSDVNAFQLFQNRRKYKDQYDMSLVEDVKNYEAGLAPLSVQTVQNAQKELRDFLTKVAAIKNDPTKTYADIQALWGNYKTLGLLQDASYNERTNRDEAAKKAAEQEKSLLKDISGLTGTKTPKKGTLDYEALKALGYDQYQGFNKLLMDLATGGYLNADDIGRAMASYNGEALRAAQAQQNAGPSAPRGLPPGALNTYKADIGNATGIGPANPMRTDPKLGVGFGVAPDTSQTGSIWDQISNSILTSAKENERMNKYTASGLTIPAGLAKEGIAALQSAVYNQPYKFGMGLNPEEGLATRSFIELYENGWQQAAKNDPYKIDGVPASQLYVDWLKKTPAAETIIGTIMELGYDPTNYIGVEGVVKVAELLKAKKADQALELLGGYARAAQKEAALVRSTEIANPARTLGGAKELPKVLGPGEAAGANATKLSELNAPVSDTARDPMLDHLTIGKPSTPANASGAFERPAAITPAELAQLKKAGIAPQTTSLSDINAALNKAADEAAQAVMNQRMANLESGMFPGTVGPRPAIELPPQRGVGLQSSRIPRRSDFYVDAYGGTSTTPGGMLMLPPGDEAIASDALANYLRERAVNPKATDFYVNPYGVASAKPEGQLLLPAGTPTMPKPRALPSRWTPEDLAAGGVAPKTTGVPITQMRGSQLGVAGPIGGMPAPKAVAQTVGDMTTTGNLGKPKPVGTPGQTAYDLQNALPEGQVERGYNVNVRTNANNPAEMRASAANEPMGYIQKSNPDTYAKAKTVYDKGYEPARTELDAMIKDLRPEAVPLAEMLARDQFAAGNAAAGREIMASVAERLTASGQFSQAAKIMRQADPQTFIMTVERYFKKLNEAGLQRYGKKWSNFDLTPQELEQIGKIPQGDEAAYKAVMESIHDRVAASMPADAFEKMREWRHMAMLFNPKTHARNYLGNAAMLVMRKTDAKVSAVLQKVILPAEKRNQAFWVGQEYKNKARAWFDSNPQLFDGGGKFNEGKPLQMQNKRVFKSAALEKPRQFLYKALNEWEDKPFFRNAYVDRLASYMKAKGITEVTDLPAEAFQTALREARQATYRDANIIADSLNKWKIEWQSKGTGGKVASSALDAMLPFTKTPMNIISRGIQYSPAGIVKGFAKIKGAGGAAAIDEIAKGLTGTGVVVLGYFLAKDGILTGKAAEDKDMAAYDKATGIAPFSIMGKYTYDWIQPFAVPLSMGVEIWNAVKEDPVKQAKMDKMVQEPQNKDWLAITGDMASTMWDAMNAAGDTVFNLSLLKNVSQTLSNQQTAGEFGANLAFDYLQQFVPTILGQAAGTIDPTMRQTHYNGGDVRNFLQTQAASALSKIPVASTTLQPRQTPFGQPMSRPKDLPARVAQQFLSPGNITESQGIDPQVDKEIRRLAALGQTSQFPTQVETSFNFADRRVQLTAPEYTRYQTLTGQLTAKMYKEVINSNDYRSMPAEAMDDALKAEAQSRMSTVNEINTPALRQRLTNEYQAKLLANAITQAKKTAQYMIAKDRGYVPWGVDYKTLAKGMGTSQDMAKWILTQ